MSAPLVRDRLWQERLAEYIERRRDEPFAWGSMDCALFAAGAVQVMTGVDPVASLVGAYSTEQGAGKVIARLGGMEAAVTRALGEPAPAAMASIGDVGLTDAGALVVCNGTTWLGAGQAGVEVMPFDGATKCWKVG